MWWPFKDLKFDPSKAYAVLQDIDDLRYYDPESGAFGEAVPARGLVVETLLYPGTGPETVGIQKLWWGRVSIPDLPAEQETGRLPSLHVLLYPGRKADGTLVGPPVALYLPGGDPRSVHFHLAGPVTVGGR